MGREITGAQMVQATLPLNLVSLGVAGAVFWFASRRAEAAYAKECARQDSGREQPESGEPADPRLSDFKLCPGKALVPLVPLALLFITAPPFQLLSVPHEWLVGAREPSALLAKAGEALGDPAYRDAAQDPFDSRLIGAAMLIGACVAGLTDRARLLGTAGAFFEGAGYALARVVSIIVAASCFGEGVRLIGLDLLVGQWIRAVPQLLLPAAGFLSLAFGLISGSGMAAAQSLFGFFTEPAVALGVPLEHVGAVVSLGAAAGRTMSPVAAVTLMCASLTDVSPIELVRRVAGPLLLGAAAMVAAAMAMASFYAG